MPTCPWILGVSASFHSGAACLMHGDEVVVAIQEERLTRRKRERVWLAQPTLCIPYCLDAAGLDAADLDLVVVSGIDSSLSKADKDVAENPILRLAELGTPTLSIPHHYAHAVSAYATSGFEDSLVMVIDGSGSVASELPESELAVAASQIEGDAWKFCEHASLYLASEEGVIPVEKHLSEMLYLITLGAPGMPAFGSLGHMFSSMAYQLFGDYLEAGKVMGLAPCGSPTIPARDFVSFEAGEFSFSDVVPERFQHDDRWPQHEKEYADLAASGQKALEEALLAFLAHARQRFPARRLSYAGGVALNSVANERIANECGFDDFHVIPAADDSGPAMGAAWYGWWELEGRPPGRRVSRDSVGRHYPVSEVERAIAETPCLEVVALPDAVEAVADRLCDGRIIGWFQEGSEFGPRALGFRSILADPRRPDAKEVLNRRVKHREAFRPFAPVILREALEDWFEVSGHSQLMDFMLRIPTFREDRRARVPAVVHVDGTGRIQAVDAETHPRLHRLLSHFLDRTGVPLLLNTSFNVMGEPIVETPEDALWCLLYTGLDDVLLGDTLVTTQAGYRSILDLVPRRVAEHDPTRGLGESRAYPVSTRWGAFVHHTPEDSNLLLDAIDGDATGWQLLERLGAAGSPLDEAVLVRALGLLFRYSIVRFQEQI